MAKYQVLLDIDDQYTIYGPADTIRGLANLELFEPRTIKYVFVSLLAGSRTYTGDATRPKHVFFLQKTEFLHLTSNESGVRSSNDSNVKHLNSGKYKWKYKISLPATNDLPPSFHYRDKSGKAEIVYYLVLCVVMEEDAQPVKELMHTRAFQYSPKRSSTFTDDTSLLQMHESLLAERPRLSGLSSRRSGISHVLKRLTHKRKPEPDSFEVTLWLPRFATLLEQLDMSVKIETTTFEAINVVLDVRLVKVHYRLWAITRIAYESETQIRRHKVQDNEVACSSLLGVDSYWMSLHRHAPFQVQSRLLPVHLGEETFSTLGPSFGTQQVGREYSLDVDLFLVIYGRTHRVRFENSELVVLPHDLRSLDD